MYSVIGWVVVGVLINSLFIPYYISRENYYEYQIDESYTNWFIVINCILAVFTMIIGMVENNFLVLVAIYIMLLVGGIIFSIRRGCGILRRRAKN